MVYQILAQKWRPQSFKEIIGQNFATVALKNSFILNKVHQSWIFHGTRGIGKTSIARILSKALNCIQLIQGEPCQYCLNCKEIKKGNFVDLIEIDAASKTKVEDIKEILENIQYAPIKGLFKIYLIDEVHMLSKHSFHALLKILEEPPHHIKFILATTDIAKVPNTIISRCLCFSLKKLTNNEIYVHLKHILKKEKIEFETKSIQIIANQSNGSIRDALNILEQAIALGNGVVSSKQVINMFGLIKKEIIFFITKTLILQDYQSLLNFLYNKKNSEINWKNLLIEIMRLLHYMILIKCNVEDQNKNNTFINKKIEKEVLNLANHCHINKIQLYYRVLIVGLKEIHNAPNLKIGAEMTFFRIINIEKSILSNTIQCYTHNFSNPI
ncbi:DNA polymerase III subunit tau, partial [isoform gamma] [Buchnera aphidicola (Thelaxes suberi)]|uniref:DNA polymerase III subunit gamma/tau n=1 Tax=Buchnera aphidicola TaxID=9 RepID=UPI00346475D1